MADVKWIKMSVDMFNNRKIRHIETLPERMELDTLQIRFTSISTLN